jgi:hypothetical protein
MKRISARIFLLGVCLTVVLAGCGGTSDSGGTGGTGVTTGVTTGVVTAYGSIVVNGVHYDETGAVVVINDAAGSGDHRGIKIGMTVKIRGSSDGVVGVATDIEAEHEVEGKVATTNGVESFTVLGQTVIVDGQTLYGPIGTAFGDLLVGTQVEVYGLRDQNNVIRATLVEIVGASEFDEEIRGTITNLNTTAMTFELSGYVIHYDGTTVFSDGGSIGALVNGLTVEVHFNTGASGNHATEIEFEDNEDSAFQVEDDGRFEIEGYVSGIIDANSFVIAGQVVQTTIATAYENGVASDLSVGRKIHVKGSVTGGQLIASRIQFD